MLKLIACLLVLCLTVQSETPEETKHFCLRSKSISKTCVESKARLRRTIEAPISEFYSNSNLIECERDDQTINVVKAVLTNSDKSKCPSSSSVESTNECNDRILSTLIASRLCNDQKRCDLSVDKNFETICKCSVQKYLQITYTCNKSKSTSNELSKSRSKRYIRIAYNLEPKYGYESDDNYGDSYGSNDNYRDSYRSNGNNRNSYRSNGNNRNSYRSNGNYRNSYRSNDNYGDGYETNDNYDDGYESNDNYGDGYESNDNYGDGYESNDNYETTRYNDNKKGSYKKSNARYESEEYNEYDQKYIEEYNESYFKYKDYYQLKDDYQYENAEHYGKTKSYDDKESYGDMESYKGDEYNNDVYAYDGHDSSRRNKRYIRMNYNIIRPEYESTYDPYQKSMYQNGDGLTGLSGRKPHFNKHGNQVEDPYYDEYYDVPEKNHPYYEQKARYNFLKDQPEEPYYDEYFDDFKY